MALFEKIALGRRTSSYINAVEPRSVTDLLRFQNPLQTTATSSVSVDNAAEIGKEVGRDDANEKRGKNFMGQSRLGVPGINYDNKRQPSANKTSNIFSSPSRIPSKTPSRSFIGSRWPSMVEGVSKSHFKYVEGWDDTAQHDSARPPDIPPTVPDEGEEEDDIRPEQFSSEFHRVIFDFINSHSFTVFILSVIFFNVGLLVALTSTMVVIRCGWYFSAIDNILLGIYIMEAVLKLYVYRLKFFNVGWNILDLIIVFLNLVDFVMPLVVQNISGLNAAAIFRILRIFRALRAIRALRVLRAIRFFSNFQVLVATILQSMRSIGAIVILMSLLMYISAVIGRGLYAACMPKKFGNLFDAFFTMYQLITLDDWFEIYTAAIHNDPTKWHIILYLSLNVIIQYFVLFNLLVAVLVDNFQIALETETKQNELADENRIIEDSDDEENYEGKQDEQSSEESEVEDVKVHTNIQDVNEGVPTDELDDIQDFLRLLVCFDYNMNILSEQHKVLNLMVELCVETTEDA